MSQFQESLQREADAHLNDTAANLFELLRLFGKPHENIPQ